MIKAVPPFYRITYDPVNGEAIPDGEVREVVERIIQVVSEYNPPYNLGPVRPEELSYSTENIFHSILLAIASERIDHKRIQFVVDGYQMTPNEYGDWPDHWITDSAIMDAARRMAKTDRLVKNWRNNG